MPINPLITTVKQQPSGEPQPCDARNLPQEIPLSTSTALVVWNGRKAVPLSPAGENLAKRLTKREIALIVRATQDRVIKNPQLFLEPIALKIGGFYFQGDKLDWTRIIPSCLMNRQIRPGFDVRFNLSSLFSKKELDGLSRQDSTNLHNRLLLKPSDPIEASPPVWMRMYPDEAGYHVEFIDPRAHDLAACDRTFCKIKVYPGKEALLDELSAPSFTGRGKKALELIWNFMKLAKIENMVFTDVSTVPRCCDDGALTSLHLLQILIYKKSWYARQDAVPSKDITYFQYAFEKEVEEEFDKTLSGKSDDGRLSPTIDYDAFRKRFMPHLLETWASEEAYQAASDFLYNVRLDELVDSIHPLVSYYPELAHLKNVLEQVSTILQIPTCTRIGSFLKTVIEKGVPNKGIMHELMHECRDHIVSNRRSKFFSYIIDTLAAEPREVSAKTLAFSFLVIDYFSDIIKGIGDPSLDRTEIILSILKDPGAPTPEAILQNLWLKEKADKNHPQKYRDKFLEMLEESESYSYVSAKLMHASKESRKKWLEYNSETGQEIYISLYCAVKFLSEVTLKELEEHYPGFVHPWLVRSGIQDEPQLQNLTIGQTIILLPKLSSSRDQRKLLDELVRGSMKHLSHFANILLEQHEDDPQVENVYELFMLSKYLCKKGDPFVLQLKE